MRRAAPGQTIGPFFGFALPYAGGPDLVPPGHPDAVRLTGRLLDAHGAPVPDGLIEIWQPDPGGAIVQRPGSLRRDGWTFTGFGRCPTDTTGRYSFTTLRPGPTEPGRAPFFAVTIFARGLLNRLFTRAYLPGYDEARADDPLLASLSDERRRTLLIHADGGELHFDIRLQGPDETVFLHYRHHDR
jgi:protocatechuate 3,4-dioxygenase alpha subunit